jgi:hypothetical protein
MSDNKKQENDFTPEVDALLPSVDSLVNVCQVIALSKLTLIHAPGRQKARGLGQTLCS